jgi:hypothetical protein
MLSASEVKEKGINVGDMDAILLKKLKSFPCILLISKNKLMNIKLK